MDRGYGMQPLPRGGFVEHVGSHGGGWPDGLSWMIFALLLVLLLLAAVSLALDAYHRSQRPRAVTRWAGPAPAPGLVPGGRALGVLGMRYARGEISRAEYLQARADLSGPPEGAVEEPTEVIPADEAAPEEPASQPEGESEPKG
jgi:uncharacterized membrane protein